MIFLSTWRKTSELRFISKNISKSQIQATVNSVAANVNSVAVFSVGQNTTLLTMEST